MGDFAEEAFSTVNPFDDEDGAFQGSGDAEAARDKQGWNSVYNANRDLGPGYMGQYGNEADARLASIQSGGMEASMAAADDAAQIGMQAGTQAREIGQQYGADASTFGQGGAAALTAAGSQAAGIGAGAQTLAAADAQRLRLAGSMGLAAGARGEQIGVQGQQTIGTAGQDASTFGVQAANQSQDASARIAKAGNLGVDLGLSATDRANQAAQGVNAAGVAGQGALTGLGQQVGQLGTSAAQLGQGFLGDRGYQAQMADANAARGQAQSAAGQLSGIEAQEGPSAAQAQLRQGLNQAQSANLAMARSGKGFGGSASALGQAQSLNAQAGQQAANQAATLRAQETAAFRQRQAANLNAAGGLQLGAGQQAMAREQLLGQQQLAQTDANRQAYLQSQGLGLQGLGQQIGAEAQGRQMALTGAQQAGQLGVAGSQLGLQGAQMGLQGQQAAAANQIAGNQMGLQGLGMNIGAQQAAVQAGLQGTQMGMQGAQQVLAANQAAGALGQQGAQTNLAGAQANIGATQAAGEIGLQGILGGGQLALGGTTAGGQLALQGNEQQQQGIGQAANIGLTAEQQRAANTQYSYGLTQAQIANQLQIAGMQAGLNVQNAGFTNQTAGALLGAGGQGIGALAAASDVNAKEDILPLSSRDFSSPDADPYGINFDPDAKDKEKRKEIGSAFSGMGGAFGMGMGGDGNLALNPITGQPWAVSDKRAKNAYAVSDERAKSQAGEMVGELDPYAFRYKDPERHGAGQHVGIMAQDLEKSAAGRTVVERAADGTKMVNTPKLTMLNSAALAQYDDRLEELEKRIARMGKKKGKAA